MSAPFLLALAVLLVLALLWKKPVRRPNQTGGTVYTHRPTSTRRSFRLQAAAAFAMLFFLTGSVAVMSILWLRQGSKPPVPPPVLAQLPQNTAGVYLVTAAGYQPLPEWHLPLQEAPEGSPLLPPGVTAVILVAQKQHFPPEQYQLFQLDSGSQIPWRDATAEGRQLRLVPTALTVGDYLLLVPTNDMFGGEIYYYFRMP